MKTIFRIENGQMALSLVEEGDPATWQAPGGLVLPAVTPADYPDSVGKTFQCQVVTGQLTSTQNSSTENLDGTWCDLPEVVTIPAEDTFAWALDLYQDPNALGISAYLYENRGRDAYLYAGMGSPGVPPIGIGVVTLSAATIGGGRGAARAQVTFPFKRAPDIMFGTAAAWRIVPGDRSAPIDGPEPGPGLLVDEDLDEDLEGVAAS